MLIVPLGIPHFHRYRVMIPNYLSKCFQTDTNIRNSWEGQNQIRNLFFLIGLLFLVCDVFLVFDVNCWFLSSK